MGVRMRTETNFAAFTGKQAFIKRFDRVVQETAEAVVRDTRQNTIAALTQDPGPVQYPIEWSSERQRRAFFATDGFGSGIPYQRTGRINDWAYRTSGEGGSVSIVIGNGAPYLKYVRGTMARRGFASAIQQMHRNTGWTAARPVVAERIDIAEREMRNRLAESLGALGDITQTRRNR